MAIINAQVTTQVQQAAGNYRVKFKYTLDDGREYFIGPVNIDKANEINIILMAKKIALMESITVQDAENAMEQGITISYKAATQNEVYNQYLRVGYDASDPLEAYLILYKVVDKILSLNLTVTELANNFNVDKSVIQSVLTRWQYLKDNEAAILAYKAVKDGE